MLLGPYAFDPEMRPRQILKRPDRVGGNQVQVGTAIAIGRPEALGDHSGTWNTIDIIVQSAFHSSLVGQNDRLERLGLIEKIVDMPTNLLLTREVPSDSRLQSIHGRTDISVGSLGEVLNAKTPYPHPRASWHPQQENVCTLYNPGHRHDPFPMNVMQSRRNTRRASRSRDR